MQFVDRDLNCFECGMTFIAVNDEHPVLSIYLHKPSPGTENMGLAGYMCVQT